MRTRACRSSLLTICCLLTTFIALAQKPAGKKAPAVHKSAAATHATAADAIKFVDDAEKRLADVTVKSNRADWVQATYITDDTEAIAADGEKEATALSTEYALGAAKYTGLQLPPDVARKLLLLRISITLPAPTNPAEQEELTKLRVGLEADYGKGKYCPSQAAGESSPAAANAFADAEDKCLDITALERLMAQSRDPKQLLDLWVGWHKISPPMRPRYARLTELSNKGARELGFSDVGVLWRAGYDMPPDQFTSDLERLWQQVRPLYLSLHAYVRSQLVKKYGPAVVPPNGPIPAHLLGNMWAQEWGNIYQLVAPPDVKAPYDLDELLKAKKVAPLDMVHYGENFFKSLGFSPHPQSFWDRSQFTKPRDRDVVCHASAWDIDNQEDVRLKMCIQVRGEDFITVHHELGHTFYFRAYENQPYLFKGGANDGFHEAIGDTMALSVTPEYLHQVGLLDQVPPASNAAGSSDADIAYLLRQALDKVAFLPFGLLIDQWRWKVFSGEIKPEDYNKSWWELRLKYQGVSPPVARSEADFDPGAKYHVAASVPYMRYFLARIYQFQFQRALCKEAGVAGPLYRCSIYGNKAAGAKLNKMLAMGASKPWPDAMEALTGQREGDATAILDYFAPLKKWLDEQNAKNNAPMGW
ncbi:MAG: peptidyl-dipeptidase [Acidobacteria bacterium]|nr:MAG: peptidyl-dipeptidase [Acidobacteriota bacterium]